MIGVVKGRLRQQPRDLNEAVAAAKMLHAQGRNFSMGLMQINRYNLTKYGLDYETVFHPCKNIQAGAAILADCFKRAGGISQTHLQQVFSCYYSGNFRTGFYADFKGQPPYVVKILNAARANRPNQLLAYSVPAVNPSASLSIPVKAVSKKTVGKYVAGQAAQTGTAQTGECLTATRTQAGGMGRVWGFLANLTACPY